MSDPIHVLSLGAGVQSSAMALMASNGDLTPMPVAAVFADTQAEPVYVYEWLEALEKRLAFPVIRVTAGSLERECIEVTEGRKRSNTGQPPFFVRDLGTDDRGGMLWRKCTTNHKLVPLRRGVRVLLKEYRAKKAVRWIGISVDEAHRMKDSRVGYETNYYPLVDHGITRRQCLKYLEQHGLPNAAKSACYFCPYTSNARWRQMKAQRPEEWQKAVEFDRNIRMFHNARASIKGSCFVHRQMVPLDEAFLGDDNQMDLFGVEFGQECEGLCGV